MTTKPDASNPRVLVHGQSAGGITRKDIERRARELALIRGGKDDFKRDDLIAARRELMDYNELETMTDDAPDDAALMSRDPRDPAAQSGKQTPEIEAEDENIAAERLALQGVDEAQHDQMLAARRRQNRMRSSDEG